MFDLGLRKDWENSPLAVLKLLEDPVNIFFMRGYIGIIANKSQGFGVDMNDNIDMADVLKENGVNLDSVEGIIWRFVFPSLLEWNS